MCKSEKMSVEDAAAALNTTPTAILMLLRRGGLSGKEEAGSWLIERSSIKTLIAARQEDVPLVECRSGCAAKVGGCASCGSDAE